MDFLLSNENSTIIVFLIGFIVYSVLTTILNFFYLLIS